MKKDIVFLALYNIIFLFFAVFFSAVENNNASFLYMLLLILVSDYFWIRYQRKLREEHNKMLRKIEKNQEILLEKERLSSLGQLIGGIAHNLKTPIMSISGGLEGINDLAKEYDESIGDSEVTEEDHHEIASDIKEWIAKIKPNLRYMTEIIDAVKGQAVSMNISENSEFPAKEFILRSELLMKDELKRRKCNLNLDINISDATKIKGELNAIVQVLDNLLINSMDAYGENGGEINLKIYENTDKVFIEVEDFAGGIADSVKDKIFNEMVTSKGRNGTGLGLYMSYSTIRGKFKGEMRFETTIGKGTIFYIELNKA